MGPEDEALAAAVETALGGWVVAAVSRFTDDPSVLTAAEVAGADARVEVGGAVRRLLALDIDEQATTPLQILRTAVRHPTAVLRAAGVAPVARDDRDRELFPDDDYGLTPANFADIDPALVEPGLRWGAWKAMAHRRRHQP